MTRIKQQSGDACGLIPEKCFESEEVIHFIKNETHGVKLKNDSSLAEILDNLTHGLLIVDQKRRINFFNAAAEQITGLSTDDVKGRACEDVFASTNSEADCRLQKVIQAGEKYLKSRRHNNPDRRSGSSHYLQHISFEKPAWTGHRRNGDFQGYFSTQGPGSGS